MKKPCLLILTGTIAAVSCAYAQTPTLWYDFDSPANAGEVNNLGSTGTDGVLTGANISIINGSSIGFSGGNALNLPNDDQASFVQTLLSSTVIGFNGDYTASAWVNMNAYGGDSMIFGQTGGNLLHDGIRDNLAHLGHWGADTGGSTNLATTFGTGNWFHLAYRRNASGQTIFVNGNVDAASGSAALANVADVIIGSNNGNGGGFRGMIDDVVVYNSGLRDNQISFLAAGGDPNALPAPLGILGPINSIAPGAQPSAPITPGGHAQWAIHEVRGFPNGAQPDNLGQALTVLKSGQGTISTGFTEVINRRDPQSGASHFFAGDVPYLTDTGADDDRIATLYRAVVKVTVPGDYTFGYHGDDGFALRIQNSQFLSQTGGDAGAGRIDPDSPDTVFFPNGTGDANMRMTANLPVGEHVIELIHWEGVGGASHELYYSKGTYVNDADTNTWRLLGGPTPPPPPPQTDFTRTIPGVTAAGWSVTSSAPRAVSEAADPLRTGTPDGLIDTNADALAALGASGVTVSGRNAINYIDPQSGAAHNFGGDVPFERDSGADDDDFALFATATLQIDHPDTYRFGFRGDDGGYLRIIGVGAAAGTADDWQIVTNATGQARISDVNGVATSDGDTIWTDIPTGDSNTQADIFLAPGQYIIEGLFWERGGGSSWEIFVGDADTGPLALLVANGNSNDPFINPPPQPELQIVPEPASVAMLLGGFGALLGIQRVRRRK